MEIVIVVANLNHGGFFSSEEESRELGRNWYLKLGKFLGSPGVW